MTRLATILVLLALFAGSSWAQEAAPAEAPPAEAPPAEAAPAEAAPPAEAPPAEAAPAEAAPAEAAPAEAPPAEAAPAEPPAPPPLTDLRQIQIQVWISETTEQGLRDIGANLNYTRFVNGREQSGSVERIRTQLFDPQNPDYTVVLPAPDTNPFPDNLRPDQSGTLADGIQTQAGAGLDFTIIEDGRGSLDGVLRAIERKSDVDLLSKPELLVVNDQQAEIHAGGEVPYQSVGSLPNQPTVANLKVEWKKVGVDMQLKPTIQPDGMIQIVLPAASDEKPAPGSSATGGLTVSDVVRFDKLRGIDLPVVSERSQIGTVFVPNGQTLVIGGLSSRIVRKNEQRVPIVGKLPVIGLPFRTRKSEATNSTLLIFVSPTIVDLRDLRPESISALNFWREEQWRHTEEIETEMKIMDEEL
jgi:Flp pilus assembly secretin CpaC